MVTGDVLGVAALLVWTFRASVKGAAARVFVVASTLLLINEAFLGALLVKLGYVTGNRSIGRVVVLSIHLSNTLLLLAALTLTALMLGTGQMWAGLGKVRGRGFMLAGLLATLVVGVSGSLAALGDTLFPAASLSAAMAQDFATGSPWLLRVRWVHPASAVVAALFVLWLVRRGGWTRSRWVVGLVGFQFVLGLADIVLLAPTWMQIVHLLGADLYWIALVLLAATVAWPVGRDDKELAKP
jgi:heme a synthase